MTPPLTRLVVRLVALTIGFGLASIGTRWLFLLGLALIVFAGSFQYKHRPFVVNLAAWALCAGAVVFLIWFSAFGTQKPPVGLFVVLWAAGVINEVGSYSRARNSHNA